LSYLFNMMVDGGLRDNHQWQGFELRNL